LHDGSEREGGKKTKGYKIYSETEQRESSYSQITPLNALSEETNNHPAPCSERVLHQPSPDAAPRAAHDGAKFDQDEERGPEGLVEENEADEGEPAEEATDGKEGEEEGEKVMREGVGNEATGEGVGKREARKREVKG
jgi:hypothetical protein